MATPGRRAKRANLGKAAPTSVGGPETPATAPGGPGRAEGPRASRGDAARPESAGPAADVWRVPGLAELVDGRGLDAAERLRYYGGVVRVLRDAEAGAVAELRAGGVSWHRIGVLAGLTAEGARRRWGGS